jgi:hypothetical protein
MVADLHHSSIRWSGATPSRVTSTRRRTAVPDFNFRAAARAWTQHAARHLFSNTAVGGKFAELDTYTISEAHDPAYAVGYGDLTVHEVATHPTDPAPVLTCRITRAASGPSRSRAPSSSEVGGYLDPAWCGSIATANAPGSTPPSNARRGVTCSPTRSSACSSSTPTTPRASSRSAATPSSSPRVRSSTSTR